MITIFRNLKFITAEFIPNRIQEGILDSMKRIQIIYSHRGFCIIDGNSNNKFEPLQDRLKSLNIEFDTVGEKEHVPEVEICICTIKERNRETWNTLLFKKMSTRVII